MSWARGLAAILVAGCSGGEAPTPPPPPRVEAPAEPPAPAPPPEDPYGPMPAEGETDLVMCSLSVVLEDEIDLALGDLVVLADGTVVIVCDGGLLAMTPLPARECRLVSHERFGVEGWMALPGLAAATDRLTLDEDGVAHVVGRGMAIGRDGQLTEAVEPAPSSGPPGTTPADSVRAASDGFVVLTPSAPEELRLLTHEGELRRVVHAGATLDFALEMVDPGARHAVLRGISNTRERLTYATYEVTRGEAREPGVVRIAGL